MKDYVTFEQMKKLIELGFDLDVKGVKKEAYSFKGKTIRFEDHYGFKKVGVFENFALDDLYCLPTMSQAQKWLRDVKDKDIMPYIVYREDKKGYDFLIDKEPLDLLADDDFYSTYEQALSAGIDKALEILKQE